jgi:hypothetical protein
MDIFKETNTGLEIALDNMSKASLKKMAANVIDNVEQGNADALEEYIKAKGIVELATSITDGLKAEAIKEAEKYGNEDKILGCSFQVKSVPYTYDFSHNEEWLLLNAHLDATKRQMKEIETKMIDAMRYAEIIDDRTGEVIPPAKIKSGGGQTVSITIPK